MGMKSATGPLPTLKDLKFRMVAKYTNDKGHTFHANCKEKVPQAQRN